ncbi:type IX secretion system sortase PorU [Luteibaculum oceani]|nr:type IX secretion system sortase PorU [Luteibaculum oceani]
MSVLANSLDKWGNPFVERFIDGDEGYKDAQRKSNHTSVLSSGNWAKLRISKSGIHGISYSFLLNNGFINGPIESSKIGVFGFGASFLDYSSSVSRPADLPELPIKMLDGGDGVFGPGDKLYFYADGPTKLAINNGSPVHTSNTFSRSSYYFISSDKGTGKRLESNFETAPNNVVASMDSYVYYSFHERDLENIGRTGRRMYGEAFEFVQNQTFSIPTKTSVDGAQVNLRIAGASHSKLATSTFKFNFLGREETVTLSSISSGSYDLAHRFVKDYNLQNINNNALNVNIELIKGSGDVKAWLDYIAISYPSRELPLAGTPMLIAGTISDTGVILLQDFLNPNSEYWDISDPVNPKIIAEFDNNGFNSWFISNNKTNKIVAYDGVNSLNPIWEGRVPNQNIHEIAEVDYIIIHPTSLQAPANRLASFHQSRGLDVVTVDVNKIYTEFSSGAKSDIGIRDFLRYVWKKDTDKLKYALLLGDGSYVNLDGFEENTNLLPTYQSANSERETSSYVSDDFYGMLEDLEGGDQGINPVPGSKDIRRSDMDIAIGRFPVTTVLQANQLIDKIERYTLGSADEIYGDWRNLTAFVADDLDGNFAPTEDFHVEDANILTEWITDNYPEFYTHKFYMDAYPQVTTPGGSRYPAINKLIKDRVQDGLLLLNYTGHGGEVGWAHERILDIGTINGWTNSYKMPIMVTATCEFSKFDDYDRVSAGELCLLNPNGGAIVMLSTTRIVYADDNFRLNQDFVEQFFSRANSTGVVRIGDVYKDSKRQYVASSSVGINHLNFSLLGDPALEIAFPKHKVVTTEINDKPLNSDTLSALSVVKLKGEVRDHQDLVLTDFNGEVEVQVFDKAITQQTLGNDNPSLKKSFKVRNSLIYKGVASVNNGEFEITFVVPKDIRLNVGAGLIQYYAKSENADANGALKNINVGGISSNPLVDDQGPQIDLYLNNLDFVSGDATGENSNLLAFLSDESGINTTGAGIGHDIIAFIDGDIKNAITLNEFYKATLDTYKEGTISYPLEGVSEGSHTLTLRAWDSNNNPGEAKINFLVRNSSKPFLEELLVYPNPAADRATFEFTHNQGGYASEATLEVFDLMGRRVAGKIWKLEPQEKGTATYTWEIKSSGSNTINPGTYVYRVTLNSESGETAVKSSKLLIVR